MYNTSHNLRTHVTMNVIMQRFHECAHGTRAHVRTHALCLRTWAQNAGEHSEANLYAK